MSQTMISVFKNDRKIAYVPLEHLSLLNLPKKVEKIVLEGKKNSVGEYRWLRDSSESTAS